MDINDTQNKFARMQHKVERDSLTGIYNRAVFEKCVNEVLADSSKRHHALFLLDIDDLKMLTTAGVTPSVIRCGVYCQS